MRRVEDAAPYQLRKKWIVDKLTKIFLAAVLAASASWSRAGEETLVWDDPAAHVTIRGTLAFTREKDALSFVKCPEGFPEDRLALMSARGAQDVASVALKGTALAFDVRLVADHPVTVRFLLPDGWRYEGSDADCRLEAGGRILAVRLVSPRSEAVSRTIPLSVR